MIGITSYSYVEGKPWAALQEVDVGGNMPLSPVIDLKGMSVELQSGGNVEGRSTLRMVEGGGATQKVSVLFVRLATCSSLPLFLITY